jgi:hypothetical protein
VAIGEWIADASPEHRAELGLTRADTPDVTTIWRLLVAVDPFCLDRVIGAWLSSLVRRRGNTGSGGRMVVAVDGKSIRGARRRAGKSQAPADAADTQSQERVATAPVAPHLMACLDHGSGAVLAQIAVGEKTNEIPMFLKLLDQIEDLREVLVTADALSRRRDNASYADARVMPMQT